MKRNMAFTRILAALLTLVCIAGMPQAYAESSDDLKGSVWAMNTWQNNEGNVMITVTDELAAVEWIGYYKELRFLNSSRFRMDTTTNGEGYSRAEGNYILQENGQIALQFEGNYDYVMVDRVGNTILYQDGEGVDGFVPIGTQSLYPQSPGSASTGAATTKAAPAAETEADPADPFLGSRWVGTSVGSLLSGLQLGGGDFKFSLGDVLSMATLVPSEKLLMSGAYLTAAYIYMDFNADHTFEMGMKTSVMGKVDEDQTLVYRGTWNYTGGLLNITAEDAYFPVLYQDGKLIMSSSGFSITLSKLR